MARRTTATATTTSASTGDPAARVAEWISSADARAAARSELARVGFPDPALGADDLLQLVGERVLVRLRAGPLDGAGGIEAYLRRSLRNAAIDTFRSGRARLVGPLLGPDDDEGTVDPPDAGVVDPADVAGRADDVRAHLLHGALADPPQVLSGALTFVALAADPALLDVARTVEPETGGARSHLLWAALAYSGRRDDLPGIGRPDDPARRKRRSRAMAAIDAALARAGHASVEEGR